MGEGWVRDKDSVCTKLYKVEANTKLLTQQQQQHCAMRKYEKICVCQTRAGCSMGLWKSIPMSLVMRVFLLRLARHGICMVPYKKRKHDICTY